MSDLVLFLVGFLVTCVVGSGLSMLIISNNREFDRARAEETTPGHDKVNS